MAGIIFGEGQMFFFFFLVGALLRGRRSTLLCASHFSTREEYLVKV